MNKLSTERRATILNMLVEGMSMRAIGHITGASINTTTKLLSDAADAAVAYDAEKTRGIKGYRHIQCDEIWSFVYAKQGPSLCQICPDDAGDTWDVHGPGSRKQDDRRLMVGERDSETAMRS